MRTAAGQTLLDVFARPWVRGMRGYEEMVEGIRPAVVAVEDEARQQAHAEVAAILFGLVDDETFDRVSAAFTPEDAA